jgi:hypothetical protein
MADIHTPVPALKLNDGASIPMLAYGTGTAWSKRSAPEEQVDRDLVEGIKTAIKMGYRHFDCAESKSCILCFFLFLQTYASSKTGQAIEMNAISALL